MRPDNKVFLRMSAGGNENEPLARLKKIKCASLPPYAKTLNNHIKRAHGKNLEESRPDVTDSHLHTRYSIDETGDGL